MSKIFQSIIKNKNTRRKENPAADNGNLHQLAFENAALANIISVVRSGRIIMANTTACKLLGYSRKELLTKSRSDIFDINEISFKKLLKQRRDDGHSSASVTAIKKTGKHFSCEITSAIFTDEDGNEKAITTLTDMRKFILKQKNIDIEKEKTVAGDIAIAKARQKEIDAENKKVVAGDIAIAKAKQKNIDTKKEKTVAGDIAIAKERQKEIDAENKKVDAVNTVTIKTNTELWKKHIGKSSYDVIWDWNIATGEIYVGDSIHEVFGCDVKKNTILFSDFIRSLLPKEKGSVERKIEESVASDRKSWNDAFIIRRHDGSLAPTISRASIVRDENGKALHLIGATKDTSKILELENKLAEQNMLQNEDCKKFLLISKLSYDVIWDWNLLTNEVFRGDGFNELLGNDARKYEKGPVSDWKDRIHPDDIIAVEKGLHDAIESTATHWEHAFRFVRDDDSIATVFDRASIIRDADGKAYRMIGAMHDLSHNKTLEEKLEQEIKLKEKQIAEASEDAKEIERSDLGKELHDNINQLLVASRMYLIMARQGGENSEMCFERSSEYMSMAIEEIRKLSKGLTSDIIKDLGLYEAIKILTRDMMEVNPVKISFSIKRFSEHSVSDKFKLNILRIVQEQLNNILKHAGATEVIITLSQSEHVIKLVMADNGIGFDTEKKYNGIGIANLKSRAGDYKGTCHFASQPGSGCILTVTFPVSF